MLSSIPHKIDTHTQTDGNPKSGDGSQNLCQTMKTIFNMINHCICKTDRRHPLITDTQILWTVLSIPCITMLSLHLVQTEQCRQTWTDATTLFSKRNATFLKLPFFWRRVYTNESGVMHHFDNFS